MQKKILYDVEYDRYQMIYITNKYVYITWKHSKFVWQYFRSQRLSELITEGNIDNVMRYMYHYTAHKVLPKIPGGKFDQ